MGDRRRKDPASLEPVMMRESDILERFRVTGGGKFRLADIDPGDVCRLDVEKEGAKEALAAGVARLRDLQERLYAQGRWSVLIILQALDAAGKDGTIEHVMSGINPQGCEVTSFKQPSATELRHDFLWRGTRALPERGRIGIFNRSYYEEVLVARVHRSALDQELLPPALVTGRIWKERFESIRDFERHLARNGVAILKFFLHISKEEQRRRLLARIEEPSKHWKFSASDLAERDYWDDYMRAYEKAIRHTATKAAPWHVVPADHKWFAHLFVAAAIVEKIRSLDPRYPEVGEDRLADMEQARRRLLHEGEGRRTRRHRRKEAEGISPSRQRAG